MAFPLSAELQATPKKVNAQSALALGTLRIRLPVGLLRICPCSAEHQQVGTHLHDSRAGDYYMPTYMRYPRGSGSAYCSQLSTILTQTQHDPTEYSHALLCKIVNKGGRHLSTATEYCYSKHTGFPKTEAGQVRELSRRRSHPCSSPASSAQPAASSKHHVVVGLIAG